MPWALGYFKQQRWLLFSNDHLFTGLIYLDLYYSYMGFDSLSTTSAFSVVNYHIRFCFIPLMLLIQEAFIFVYLFVCIYIYIVKIIV